MPDVRGCDLPGDLYYLVEKHVWARLAEGNLLRVGMTAVGARVSVVLVAVTVRKRALGQVVEAGRAVATLESKKYVSGLPAPVTGLLLRGNPRLVDDPELVLRDPYGEGWIVEMQPSAWEQDRDLLLTGEAALAAYEAKMAAENIRCDE